MEPELTGTPPVKRRQKHYKDPTQPHQPVTKIVHQDTNVILPDDFGPTTTNTTNASAN